jgi:hypothetical protein
MKRKPHGVEAELTKEILISMVPLIESSAVVRVRLIIWDGKVVYKDGKEVKENGKERVQEKIRRADILL